MGCGRCQNVPCLSGAIRARNAVSHLMRAMRFTQSTSGSHRLEMQHTHAHSCFMTTS